MDINNLHYAETMFQQWKEKKITLPSEWETYFQKISAGKYTLSDLLSLVPPSSNITQQPNSKASQNAPSIPYKQRYVDQLINAYRELGCFYAHINPLFRYQTPQMSYMRLTVKGITLGLNKEDFSLQSTDLQTEFSTSEYLNNQTRTLANIIKWLEKTYCENIGYEFLHIKNRVMRHWLLRRIESSSHQVEFSSKQKIRFQKDLIKASAFESFIQSNFIGQKRFSLEGAELLVPAIHYLIYRSSDYGIKEIVLGMPHRGRLNLFVNAFRKPASEIFGIFIDKPQQHEFGGSGDVKYHLGHSFTFTDKETERETHLSLVANPSHLEAVNPVVLGKTRGNQRRKNDRNRKKIIPVLIHGDASFSGQGIVAEIFNLSQLEGYRTGGTIHIVVNNQIGFTTASRNSRSTFFCTDIARMLSIPVFHVNGDVPEDVIRCIDIAIAWRQKFGQDVVIDLVCYRRRGHNESDEPSYTHPLMYSMIKNHPTVSQLYGQELHKANVYSEDDQKSFHQKYIAVLKQELEKAKKSIQIIHSAIPFRNDWKHYKNPYSFQSVSTSVSQSLLDKVAKALTSVPEEFSIHPKLNRIINDLASSYKKGTDIAWSFAEQLSWGSLLLEGYPIRLSGEDSGRGTFSQRHVQWWDAKTPYPKVYVPLSALAHTPFSIYNSPLSEFSVLGFDYGYSLSQPNTLVLWEAQYGDFANGAQVIIDQFISSGEWKWQRASGIVLLLPHGYEGQGPEHSSAHLERFLQLCAMDNMQVVNLTTPAQYFHILRKQIKQNFRIPLIVMSPKSLLRSPQARSSVHDLTEGSFQYVLEDHTMNPQIVTSILFCSGKVYYDLKEYQTKKSDVHTAIVRIEQLYPWPEPFIIDILKKYSHIQHVTWVQEEAKNHGAWSFIHEHLTPLIDVPLYYAGRKAAPSPASGSAGEHQKELKLLLETAFEQKKLKQKLGV